MENEVTFALLDEDYAELRRMALEEDRTESQQAKALVRAALRNRRAFAEVQKRSPVPPLPMWP